jgi:hypothetical protein
VFFKDKVQVRDAVKVVTGTPFVPSSRPGPWAVKKAFQSLLDRIPGHHLQWNAVTKWERSAKSSNSSSSTWAPEKEMLMEGIAYINENAPESDANNEQYGWILLNLLPAIYPLFVCYGVMALKWPGVGKAPALIAMIVAMGRYHIHRLQEEDARPAWRRAKSF